MDFDTHLPAIVPFSYRFQDKLPLASFVPLRLISCVEVSEHIPPSVWPAVWCFGFTTDSSPPLPPGFLAIENYPFSMGMLPEMQSSACCLLNPPYLEKWAFLGRFLRLHLVFVASRVQATPVHVGPGFQSQAFLLSALS